MVEEDIQKRIDELEELAKAKNWESLEEGASQFIEDYPERAEGYFCRGTSKNKLGRYKEAIKDYDKAVDLAPRDTNAFNNRGSAKDKLGQHKEAISDFNRAIEINPNDADYYYNRGNAKQII